MEISLLTVLPELYGPFLSTSLVGRAQSRGIVRCNLSSFRDYAVPKERIDGPVFGPGVGMLIKPEIVDRAVQDKERQHGKAYKVFFSPDGERFCQKTAHRIAEKAQARGHLMLVAGRYEGMDARVESYYADEVISLGDFVVMGGDLPGMLLLEAVMRLIPGVVGKQESVQGDSFYGPFVDYPHYTEPVIWHEQQVPDIVRSGNHGGIEQWRRDQAITRSVMRHFAWLRSWKLSKKDRDDVYAKIPSHYSALLHTEVLVGKEKRVGETSVTSIDIHDIARSCHTFGMKGFFLVTPLLDQQKIVGTLLDFWLNEAGQEYNSVRHEALKQVTIAATLHETVAAIEQQEGRRPLVVATSARAVDGVPQISYSDQHILWATKRPILLLFGTGQGLTEECIKRCDYLLPPITGFTDFNHLSVRSAAAIVFDRWLGVNEKYSK